MSELSPPIAAARAQASQLLQRGQGLEASGTPESLTEALRSYEQAIAVLHPLQGEPHCRADLAVAWMNRGNALQRVQQAEAVAAAIQAYDQTISLLRSLPLETEPALRNIIGAAWMNRGHACQQFSAPEAKADALRSHREALTWLESLDANAHPAFSRNLAGARVNLATALLEIGAPGAFEEALNAARAALPLVQPAEQTDPMAADLSLKARRAQCVAIGQLVVQPATPEVLAAWTAEASDAVDDGLALARRWEAQGARFFRPLAVRLFHFGAHLYLRNQPQFLAEFLLESIDPEAATGAMPDEPDLYAVARETLDRARAQYGRVGRFTFGTPEADRELEIWRELQTAEARLADLWQRFGPPPAAAPSEPASSTGSPPLSASAPGSNASA